MDPRQERDKAQRIVEELVTLGLPSLDHHERTTLTAAISSWVKWASAAAAAEFIDRRLLEVRGHGEASH